MSPKADSVRILRWTANPKRQAIRVDATCAGVMCIIYLNRGNDLAPDEQQPASFCITLYDSIQEPYFQFATRTHRRPVQENNRWLRPLKGSEFMPETILNPSNELFDLVRLQLPKTLQGHASTCPPPAISIFRFFTVDDDPEHPGQALINMRSDVYQYASGGLCDLEPERFPSIERIDLSRIRTFDGFAKVNLWPQVLKVNLEQADGDCTEELILKIGELPDYEGPEGLSQRRMESVKSTQQRLLQELSNWSRLWGHENIMSPPKYLVTVQDGDRVKLVGWLQVVYRDWSKKLMRPHVNKGDHTTAYKLLGYITDLARGMLHMTKKGYVHPDVQWHNCLFAGPEHDDHLVIIDFEPFGVYSNPIGPESPEVRGHWDVSLDAKGDLVYSCIDSPGRDRLSTILTDWADFPEALERLQVFTFASAAADMLEYRSPDRDHWPPHCLLLKEDPEASLKEAWERFLPDAAKTLLEECWSFDPRHRPLFADILRRLTEIRSAMDASTSTDISQDQSKDIASSI